MQKTNRMTRDMQAARFEAVVLGGELDELSVSAKEKLAQVLSPNIYLITVHGERRL